MTDWTHVKDFTDMQCLRRDALYAGCRQIGKLDDTKYHKWFVSCGHQFWFSDRFLPEGDYKTFDWCTGTVSGKDANWQKHFNMFKHMAIYIERAEDVAALKKLVPWVDYDIKDWVHINGSLYACKDTPDGAELVIHSITGGCKWLSSKS